MRELKTISGTAVEIGGGEMFPKDALVITSKIPTHRLLRVITKIDFEGKIFQVRFTFDPDGMKVLNQEGYIFSE